MTGIKGRAGRLLDQIQFFTNKGKYSPVCGGNGGDSFTMQSQGKAIVAAFGNAGDKIDKIGVVWNDVIYPEA